jgi:hypothetical protein
MVFKKAKVRAMFMLNPCLIFLGSFLPGKRVSPRDDYYLQFARLV